MKVPDAERLEQIRKRYHKCHWVPPTPIREGHTIEHDSDLPINLLAWSALVGELLKYIDSQEDDGK